MSTGPGDAIPSVSATPRAVPAHRLVRTQPVDLVGTLLQRLPRADGALAWVADGDGLVGWGEAARIEVSGPDRFEQARDWWRAFVASCTVDDEVGVRGSGPVAFGSFSFAPTGTSVLVVPQVTLGRRAGTHLADDGRRPAAARVARPRALTRRAALLPRPGLGDRLPRVGGASRRAAAGRRAGQGGPRPRPAWRPPTGTSTRASSWPASPPPTPAAGRTPSTVSSARPLSCTSAATATGSCRGCWPVRPRGAATTSRTTTGSTPCCTRRRSAAEHQYAVESLVDALSPHVRDLEAPAEPHALELSNVTHLATDVVASLNDGSDVLDLVAAVHPTAAVGGTPTDVALGVLGELEAMDRGRYAGPIGWVDARGDGEWGIALRCAQLDGPDRAAVRRLRHRRRLRPRRRGARGPVQARPRPRRPRGHPPRLTFPRERFPSGEPSTAGHP